MTAPRLRLLGLTVLVAAVSALPAQATSSSISRFWLPQSSGNVTEAAIAVDPRDARRIEVLATDFDGTVVTLPAAGEQTRVGPTCRFFDSLNAGSTWASADFAGSHLPTTPYISSSNATLAADSTGHLYAACLSNNANGGGAVVFAHGQVGFAPTGSTLLSTPGAGVALTPDKPWITTTPDGSSIAVVWAEFVTNPGESQIVVRVSHDFGATFGAPHVVSPPVLTDGEALTSSGLPCAEFLPSGALVTAWHAAVSSGPDVVAINMDSEATVPVANVVMRSVAASGVQGRYPRHANQPSLALDPSGSGVLVAGGIQTPAGVRSGVVHVDPSGGSSPVLYPSPRGSGDQLNAAIASSPQGALALTFQGVVDGNLDTYVSLRNARSTAWRTLRLSSKTTSTMPYTASSNGTPIGDFLMIVSTPHGFLTIFPEQRGQVLQLRGVMIRVG